MSYIYADRNKTNRPAEFKETAPQPTLKALRAGTAQPTREQMGHRVDLPDVMRDKMENAFGADLSSVKLYESESVADAGANAITRGEDIAFAPGMLDFTSSGGQALLGHEISHVVSQQRGEVTGGGFLNDHALESRADRDGAMAAAGQQISALSAPLSPVSAVPATGPMQASKADRKQRQQEEASDLEMYFDEMEGARKQAGNARQFNNFTPDEMAEMRYEGYQKIFNRYAAGSSRGARGILSKKRDAAQSAYDNEVRLMQSGEGRYASMNALNSSDVAYDLQHANNLMSALESARKGKQYIATEMLGYI